MVLAMKSVYSLVLFYTSVHLVWQNRLVALEYIHPGRNVTYECTASGGQFTVWKGSALGHQCVITLYHGHFGTKNAFGSCNNGMVVGRGIRREKDNYTSLLTIFVSPDLNGKMVECHLIDGGHGEIRVNYTMLHLFFSALKPPVLKCKPYYLNSTRTLVRLQTTFDKIQPFINSGGGKVSVLSYTIMYSASNSGNICESATISASSCDQHHICEHIFEVSASSCPLTTDIDVAIFADSTNGRGPTSNPLKREGINIFVDVRYDQERNAVTCFFQNQPVHIRKECSIIYTGLQPKRRFGVDSNFVAINDTSLNTNCFDEVRVEARSGIHTPVSVIMDSKEGSCLKAASHNVTINIIGSVFGGVAVVAVSIICILCYLFSKRWLIAARKLSQIWVDAGKKLTNKPERNMEEETGAIETSHSKAQSGTREEMVRSHSVVDGSGKTVASHELQLSAVGRICSALDDVEEPFELGVHLRIGVSVLRRIEKEHSDDTERQKMEMIVYWLRNTPRGHLTWEVLAKAVEDMGDKRNLAERLRDLDSA